MRMNLIPQPQSVRVVGAAGILNPRGMEAMLAMPEASGPLERTAERMFAAVRRMDAVEGLYRLHTLQGEAALPLPPASPEGYVLRVGAGGVSIASRGAAGVYYALMTLAQLCEQGAFQAVEIIDFPVFAMRGDYLDLRNVYPKFENLLAFIREMSQYKLNTLVVEWEDKIPFAAMHRLRHGEKAFSPEQLAALQRACQDHFIELIPLQQSFGHLEYALKLPEYMHLRETPDAPGEMCPLREGSYALAAALIADMAALHPESRYLHLGCDEVWSLGKSEECRASGLTREQISIAFMNRLIDAACDLGKTPIIWQDMIEKAADADIETLDKRAIVAIWLYSAGTVNRMAPPLMDKLDRVGIAYVACSAVRCSDGETDQNYPVIENRLRNIDAWITLARQRQCFRMIHTNWASNYALGSPYGLFETSRYPAYYAADRCWNPDAGREDFLSRFLAVYHGIEDVPLYGGAENRYDYYNILPDMLDKVKAHADTAELIALMGQYQQCWYPAHLAFRGMLFPDSEVEMACLRERAVPAFAQLARVEAALRALLPRLLDADMAELFITSRMYPLRLFQRELESMLGQTL